MLSKNEIKERFFKGDRPIDRHGNFLTTDTPSSVGQYSFVRRMHYALLEGMPQAEAREILKKHDLSDAEINFLMKKTIGFIEDVLDIPLDEVVSSRQSTAGHVWTDVIVGLKRLTTTYQTEREKPINWNGNNFQADLATSRKTMLDYLATNTEPGRWVTLENDYIENFSLNDLKELYASIVNRDKELFEQMSSRKQALRSAAEKNDYDTVSALLLEWFK